MDEQRNNRDLSVGEHERQLQARGWPGMWDEVFQKITSEADRDIWQKAGLRLTWREVELLASVLRGVDGLPFSQCAGVSPAPAIENREPVAIPSPEAAAKQPGCETCEEAGHCTRNSTDEDKRISCPLVSAKSHGAFAESSREATNG